MTVHYGDYGTQIDLTCVDEDGAAADISGGTGYAIVYRKPDGTTGTWTADLSGTQIIRYTTSSGDIDASGDWVLQGKATFASSVFYTTKVTMTVLTVIV